MTGIAKRPASDLVVVDDDEFAREMYRRYLSGKEGGGPAFEIREAGTGTEGLALCAERMPDCVLLDYHLPDMDGLEFLAKLSGSAEPPCPVVILTGHSSAPVAVQALKKGAQDYIVKDQVNRETLRRTLRNAMLTYQMKRKIETHRTELARRNDELQTLSMALAHDLKMPLQAIREIAQSLQAPPTNPSPGEQRAHAREIADSAQRLEKLIDSLILFTGVASATGQLGPVDLVAVIEEVKLHLRKRIQETGGVVEHDSLPTLFADRTQMHQLFLNVIDNALRYHKPGVAPIVRISGMLLDRSGNHVVQGVEAGAETAQIVVEDNGQGLSADDMQRIFLLFQRLRTEKTHEGHGVGLAIAKAIVERHGGTILAQGEPGRGTRFVIRLPMGPDPSASSG
jgi:signal transduction histidine kinase